MKSSKRAVALFMSLIFVLTSVFSFSAVVAGAADFSDVADTSAYYEAITNLVEDGVINGYEDGTFKPDNTITRAEFSKLLATSSAPTGTQFNATNTQFPDVADSTSSSAWAIPYIAYAVGTGAINGYDDGTFRPTNTVTYGEAVKMIVCTLGYGPVVDTTLTPWYQGYIDIANQIGLSKNAVTLGDNPAPRGLVAQLIYNMLSCNPLVQTGTDLAGNPIYSTSNGSSFSESKDNSTQEEGVVLGVIDYSLTGASIKRTQVLIDDTLYGIGSYDADTLKAYVGKNVTFKYNTKDEITSLRETSGTNQKIVVDADLIDSVSDTSISYFADEDAEYDNELSTISMANMYVVYNGVPVNPSDIGDGFDIEEKLNVEDGSITFLSNDGNPKTAEVAFVESYVTYFANTPSTNNGVTTIYDLYPASSGNAQIALDEDDVTVKRVTTKGGTASESTLSAITKNSVVSIAVPYGTTENTSVIFSTYTVTKGEVKEMSSDYGYVKIGSEEYEVAPYFRKLLDKGENVSFSTNDVGKFYFDRLGRIVFFEKTQSTNPYALAIRYKKTSGFDAQYALEIFTSGTSTTTYELKDKVKVNNGNSLEAAEVVALLETLCPADYSASNTDDVKYIIQPIRYSTSISNGKTVISAIECMYGENKDEGNIVPYAIVNNKNASADIFANGGTLTHTKSGYTFKHEGSTQFSLSSSSTVFTIPQDITDTSAYRKYSYSSFNEGSEYVVEPYDVEKGVAKVMLYYATGDTKASIYANTPAYIIESISDAKNSSDQTVKKIKYYKAGSSTVDEAYTDADSSLPALDTLQPGDVVKFAFTDGAITMIKTIYTGGKLTTETASVKDGIDNYISATYDSVAGYYEAILGTVYTLDADSNTLNVIPDVITTDKTTLDAGARQGFTLDSSVVYYKYDTKLKAVQIKADSDVLTYEAYETVDTTLASQVLAIVMNKKVVAVYILN